MIPSKAERAYFFEKKKLLQILQVLVNTCARVCMCMYEGIYVTQSFNVVYKKLNSVIYMQINIDTQFICAILVAVSPSF
jgi:hypothetical protein